MGITQGIVDTLVGHQYLGKVYESVAYQGGADQLTVAARDFLLAHGYELAELVVG